MGRELDLVVVLLLDESVVVLGLGLGLVLAACALELELLLVLEGRVAIGGCGCWKASTSLPLVPTPLYQPNRALASEGLLKPTLVVVWWSRPNQA